MPESNPDSTPARRGEIVVRPRETAAFSLSASLQPTPEGAAALEAAEELARSASAPATSPAYKADWTHFADWCAGKDFVPVPAAPEVGSVTAKLCVLAMPPSEGFSVP